MLNSQMTGAGAEAGSLHGDGDATQLRRQGNTAFKDGHYEEAV